MKYKNATAILPAELIDEIQDYIQGEYLYTVSVELYWSRGRGM